MLRAKVYGFIAGTFLLWVAVTSAVIATWGHPALPQVVNAPPAVVSPSTTVP